MRRFRLLLPAAILLTSCGRNTPRPNVLLITIDTLRADHVGCYGYSRPTTPHIDRLAARGALFERMYTTLPRTTQSVATILTGKYPKSHGARGLFSRLSETNLTLAEILKAQDYDTAAFVSNLFLRPGQGFEQGFDRYDNPRSRWDNDSAAAVSAAALDWLRARRDTRPFFLWVHYLDPHWTYRPLPPFDRAFDPGFRERFTLYEDLEAGRLTKGQVIFDNRLDPAQVEHVKALYDGEIAQVDGALGPLLDYAARKDLEPLLTVLTSDHGESLGEQGYHFAHGEYLYQPTLRVPLLVCYPGRVPAGLRIDALAENVDIAPTITALLGLNRLQGVDGRPLLVPSPDARNGNASLWSAAPGRSVVFAESDYQLIHPENHRYYIPGPAGRWSSAFDGRYELIHIPRPGGEILELYDLAADPGETRNLDGAEADPVARKKLHQELQSYVDYDTGPPVPPREIDPEERQRLKSLGYIN
jgi:arylsulfatase A-like enzyme